MPNPNFHVFLSHNSADKPAVEELARRLRAEHVEPWLDKWHLIPGDPWMPAIEDVLAECGSCAVCIGAGGIGTWQDEEMRAAINRRVNAGRAADPKDRFRVIPVLLPGVARPERSQLPAFLVSTTWVEFRASLDEAEPFRRLLCGIRGVEPGDEPGRPVLEGQCPYRGLEFFDEAHAAFFFGREALTEWLVAALRRSPSGAENRFLAVLGPSGSGKSSLARAGLVPALKAGGLDGSADWPVVVMQPGAEPLESLAVALTKAGGGEATAGAVHGLMADLRANDNALHLTARLALRDAAPARRLVLLVDHFEEVFTLCPEEAARKAFIDNLMRAASASGGQTVVLLAMRADFLGKCATHPTLAAALSDHQALVGPMNEDELRRAIERPARLVGCEVEPGLVDVLIQDVQGQSGALPLMQYALLELWKRRDGRRLTLEAYHAVGGLRGALERRANEVLSQFTEGEKELCRRIFLRLTQPGEGTEDTKRRATMRELASVGSGEEAVRSVLGRLADARLITAEGDDKRPEDGAVDVAHEALIRGWSELRKWIDADRAGLRTQRRLTEAAREWEGNGRDASFLYGGARLATAKEWAESHREELNVLESAFLTASVEAEGKQKADEVAKAKARLALERWRLRLTLALAATLLLAVTGAGAAALWYQHDQHLRAAEHDKRARDTEHDVAAALEEATALGEQAEAVKDDPAKWGAALTVALSAVKRAEGVLNNGEGADPLRLRVDDLRQKLDAADKDRRLMAWLEEARLRSAVAAKHAESDAAGAAGLYAAAFEKDMRLSALSVDQAAERINQRAIREGLLAGLDDWADVAQNKADSDRLLAILRAADPDPGSFRNRVPALLEHKDWDGLRQLAFGSQAKEISTASLERVGRALQFAGAAPEAVTFLNEANDHRPGDFWITVELASAFAATRPPQLDEEIRYFTAAVTLRPGSAGAHVDLGIAFTDKGRLAEAEAEFRKGLELNPDDALAHNGLGLASIKKGRTDEAIAECRRAVELEPDDALAHNGLGLALYAKGQTDEAISEYKRAVELAPDDAEAHKDLGVALSAKGRQDEAIAEYKRAVELEPDVALGHYTLGLALYAKGRTDEAISEYKRAVELEPGIAVGHYGLGVALCAKGQTDEAIVECRKAVELEPDVALARYALGLALYAKGRTDEAVAEYKRATELAPDFAEAHYGLGLTLHAKGRTDEAIAEYKRAVELAPNYAEAHNGLGSGLSAKGRMGEAITECRKAVALKPDFAEAHYNLGAALRDKGLTDEAGVEFMKAVELKPDYPEAYANYGLTLWYQGRFRESLAAYRRCHELGTKRPGWSYPSADWVRAAETSVRQDAMLPVILRGEAEPASPAAGLQFAYLCQLKRGYADAARLYAQSFAAQPSLAGDLSAGYRYRAACAAALAACGKGEDAATSDDKTRTRWRKQALDWLRPDLAAWTKKIDGGKPEDRAAAIKVLQHWQEDSDLAGARDKDALTKLSPDEQDAWRKLWADVDALVKKA